MRNLDGLVVLLRNFSEPEKELRPSALFSPFLHLFLFHRTQYLPPELVGKRIFLTITIRGTEKGGTWFPPFSRSIEAGK